MQPVEYACVYPRPTRERLVAAERLVRALPTFLPGVVASCDLHHLKATRYFALVIRAAAASLDLAALARLAFWTARTGGCGFAVAELSPDGRQRFHGELNLCDRNMRELPLDALPDAAARLLRAVGSPPPAEGAPVMAVDLDGPGRDGLRIDPGASTVFVAGPLSPPVGDRIPLAVRVRGEPRPVDGWGTVTSVVTRSGATPGNPAGFALRVDEPPALLGLLAERLPSAPPHPAQAAPRFAVTAPVAVKDHPAAEPAAPAPAPVAEPAPPHAQLEYATEEELAADWLQNLSHGGAFVRTAQPRPEGTRLLLDLALPDGVRLEAEAVVASVTPAGMGLRFVLTPEQDDRLAATLARISARPRRALVVDDDSLVRCMLGDALAARGFEVVTAADAEEGLHRLAEELLSLDLLVTDVCMPGMDGEALVRFIRRAGGEADLAIVAISGRLEEGVEGRLEAAGADAVVDKALGAELVAAAADAALERKRLAAG